MQANPMPGPEENYPPGLPAELRAWHDSVPIDDEALTPEERRAIAEGRADAAAGRVCSDEDLEQLVRS